MATNYLLTQFILHKAPIFNINMNSRDQKYQFYRKVNSLLRSNLLTIDKTLLIRQIIQTRNKAILITRPKGWGKTVNMDMLYGFLNRNLDREKGHRFFYCTKYTCQLLNKKQLRSSASIQKERQFYKRHCCKYSVIYLNGTYWPKITQNGFDKNQNNYYLFYRDQFFRSKIIENEFDEQIIKYKSFVGKEYITLQEYFQAISLQAVVLQKIYGKKVYILIDDYDYTIIKNSNLVAIYSQKQKLTKEINQIVKRVKQIILILLENNSVQKIILSGVHDILRHSKQLSQVLRANITSHHFSRYYGFSEEELQRVIEHLFMKKVQHLRVSMSMLQLLNWLKNKIGRSLAKNSNGEYTTIYRPADVKLFLIDLVMENTQQEKEIKQQQFLLKLICSVDKKTDRTLIRKLHRLNTTFPVHFQYSNKMNFLSIRHLYPPQVQQTYLVYYLLYCGYITGKVENGIIQAYSKYKLTAKLISRDSLDSHATHCNDCYINRSSKQNIDLQRDLYIKYFCNPDFKLKIPCHIHLDSEKKTHHSFPLSVSLIIPTLKQEIQAIAQKIVLLNGEDAGKSHEDALWTICENDYLSILLAASKTNTFVTRFVLRPIILKPTELKMGKQIYWEDYYNYEEAQRITDFFSCKEVIEYLSLNKRKGRRQILRINGCHSIGSLLIILAEGKPINLQFLQGREQKRLSDI